MNARSRRVATKQRNEPKLGVLTVTLHDSAGEPRRRALLECLSRNKILARMCTDDDGQAEFNGLLVGETYYIRVNGEEAYEEIDIARSHESIEIEYDGELSVAPADEDDVPENDEEREIEEDLDTLHEELD